MVTLGVPRSATAQEEDPPAAPRAGGLPRKLCGVQGAGVGGSTGMEGSRAPLLSEGGSAHTWQLQRPDRALHTKP